jgi:hypothetical protein
VSRRALLFFRWGVFAAACAFLYLRLSGHQGMHGPWALWRSSPVQAPWVLLAVVGALMLVNWAIEARKWQVLMRPIQRLSFLRACTGTVAGTSIGLITPNRVGEFAGRVLFLEPEHRVQGSFATLLGSIAQFVVTLLVGGVCLMFSHPPFISGTGAPLTWTVVTWSALLIGFAAVFLYFSPGAFARVLLAIPLLKRFERHAHVLDGYERAVLVHVFGLSLVRYVVFSLQFALLLQSLAEVSMGDALLTVPVVFLVTTLVPTTALTELGIRGSVAAAFIPGDPAGIVLATALIWLVNIVLPALAGLMILLVARINTTKGSA